MDATILLRHLRHPIALLLAPLCAAQADAGATPRPNFVLVIADDVSADDLGCYGHPTIATPHLDRLAAEGLRFTQAYLTASSCSPSRCSVITGRYPHNTGAPELHTELPAGQFLFPQALRAAGYHTVLSGKNHMGPAVRAAFDEVRTGEGPGRQEDWVEVLRERPRDRPFFCWFASSDAHRGWQQDGHAPRYRPEDAVVPPWLVDGPRTRRDLAGYYHEVSRADHYVGELRAELERQGIAGDTYVVFLSDNGRPFPRCKTRLYDSGIKTPLIAWRPGALATGVSESLISAIDLAPTILELAGVAVDARVQGVSFAAVLADPAQEVRRYAFAEHNWHVFSAHERMVRTGEWLLIRNAWPGRQLLCVEAGPRYPAGAELWAAEAAGRLGPDQRDVFRVPRPALELFRCSDDPHQLRDLAGDERYREVRESLEAVLDRWAEETGDTVPVDPTPDRQDAQGNEHQGFARGTMPGASRDAARIVAPGPR